MAHDKYRETAKKFRQNAEDHPHLLTVYRDKISKLGYLWSIMTERNIQVDQAFIVGDGEEIEIPGDWVITIKKNIVIVTCEGFIFSRRTPAAVMT